MPRKVIGRKYDALQSHKGRVYAQGVTRAYIYAQGARSAPKFTEITEPELEFCQ